MSGHFTHFTTPINSYLIIPELQTNSSRTPDILFEYSSYIYGPWMASHSLISRSFSLSIPLENKIIERDQWWWPKYWLLSVTKTITHTGLTHTLYEIGITFVITNWDKQTNVDVTSRNNNTTSCCSCWICLS